MANTNCLEGIKCPKCGSDDRFYVEVHAVMAMTDEGMEDVGNGYDHDDTSRCSCLNDECEYTGVMADFKGKERMPAPESEEMKIVKQLARMSYDGEEIGGKEFIMENDDAVNTLNELIMDARNIVDQLGGQEHGKS